MAEYKKPTYKEPAAYNSPYGKQIDNMTNAIVNRQPFSYDPNTDPAYKSYAKEYGRLGDRARINTLGDYAANTGGYASSYAVSAAQQAQNDYNQQLSMMIPQLMQAAYDRYQGDFNMNLAALGALTSRDDSLYGRWNDNRNYKRGVYESDRSFGRGVYESDRSYAYQKAQDAIANAMDKKYYNLDLKKFNWSTSQGNSGSGGGSRRSGGGRSSSGGSSSSGSSGASYVTDGQGNQYIDNGDGTYTDANGVKYTLDANGNLIELADDKLGILKKIAVKANRINSVNSGAFAGSSAGAATAQIGKGATKKKK